jgi:hypothetical protein
LTLTASLTSLQRVRIATVAVLALALLWTQMVGQWHGVVHPPGFAVGVAPAGPAVFDHDAGDAQCRLLDQLSHADSVPCVPLLALPVGLSAALVVQSVGLAVARWAALFQARAPPSFR